MREGGDEGERERAGEGERNKEREWEGRGGRERGRRERKRVKVICNMYNRCNNHVATCIQMFLSPACVNIYKHYYSIICNV